MNFTEQKESTGFKQSFITGPVVVDNILINPTLQELKDYGVGYLNNEPNYVGENNDVKYVDITCWAKSVTDPAIILNWNIRLNAANITNQAGDKTCFINDKGNTSWAADIESLPEWFKTPGVRKALQGEEQFYSFLSAFNNIVFRKDDNTLSIMESQDSLNALFNGKFGDLKGANTLRGNKVKLIVGLREKDEKFYHQVYNKQFFKHWDEKPYLYESAEKKGYVEWPYYINYLINVDVNNKFNPVIWSGTEEIYNLDDVKEKYATIVKSEPGDFGITTFETKQPEFKPTTGVDDLPF